jgi:poly-beta-hydroxyalkanoate depolymerase
MGLRHGAFGFEEFIDHVITFFQVFGTLVHVGVCQPCVAVLAAADWFERNLIGIVRLRYAGALRRIYPGFVQLAAFMSTNLDRHVKAQIDLFCHLTNGEDEKAAAIRAFYDEYCA